MAQKLRRRIAAVNESNGRPNPTVASTAPVRVLMTRPRFPAGARICAGTGASISYVVEREASGDFDYLWDDPADAEG